MVGRYQAYSKYKDSGLEWLGKLPKHWGVKRLGQFFAERREKVSDKDYPALSVTMQGIVPQLETAAKTDAGDNRKLVLKNDFVINSRSDRKGSAGVSSYDGSVSLISIVMEPKLINPKFVHHLLRSYPFQEEFYRYGKGIVADLWSTNSSEMKNILIPDLPGEEQQQIADFLDHETAKIDTLIEKQQQFIKLLKEKRQAAISQAVTKGLNSDAPMRDSGVEWLEEVPEHWKVCRVKQVSGFITSGPRGWSDFLSEKGEKVFLQSGDLTNKLGLRLKEAKKVSPPNNAEGVRTKLKFGDVVVCITGANTGRVAIVPKLHEVVYINQHLSLIRPVQSLISSEYLGYVLSSSSVRAYFSVTQYGLKEGLSLTNIAEAPLCCPALKEQKRIVNHIKQISCKYDSLEGKAIQQVELLRERRTGLISAAVTGKIDVRNWQVPQQTKSKREDAA